MISTYPERAKARNARRDQRASICVVSDDFGRPVGPGRRPRGGHRPARLAGALVEYFRCISGEHPDWDEYREAMAGQGKSLIRVTIERWGPIATGGFPARLADG